MGSINILPDTPVAAFSHINFYSRVFLEQKMHRDDMAISQLRATIEDNRHTLNAYFSDTNITRNHDVEIERVTDLIGQDISEIRRLEGSFFLLEAIYKGDEPPINNTDAWLDIKNDLDNSNAVGIEDLKEYVQNVYDTNIRDQWVQNHPINFRDTLPQDRSRDNSEYSVDIEELISDTNLYEAASNDNTQADTNMVELSTSDSDSDDNNQDESSSSDSDSDDNPPATGQASNANNNQSDVNIQSNLEVNESQVNFDWNQNNSNVSEPDINQATHNNESNASGEKKFFTDDVLDISETLEMFYDESSGKKESTIDFVLERQREEMPDIFDSDGGE